VNARNTASTRIGSRVDLGERLVLSSRGQRVVIGRFLSPDERDRVAGQLKSALAAMPLAHLRPRLDLTLA